MKHLRGPLRQREAHQNRGFVIELAGHAACGKTYLIDRLIDALESRGVPCVTGGLSSFRQPRGPVGSARLGWKAARWALRASRDAPMGRLDALRVAYAKTRSAFAARLAPRADTVYVIDQGLMHRAFYSLAGRFWTRPEMIEPLAIDLLETASLTPDLLIQVRAHPRTVLERRMARAGSASSTAEADVEKIEAMFAFTDRLQPHVDRVALRSGIQVLHVDTSSADTEEIVRQVMCRIPSRLDAHGGGSPTSAAGARVENTS